MPPAPVPVGQLPPAPVPVPVAVPVLVAEPVPAPPAPVPETVKPPSMLPPPLLLLPHAANTATMPIANTPRKEWFLIVVYPRFSAYPQFWLLILARPSPLLKEENWDRGSPAIARPSTLGLTAKISYESKPSDR